MDSVCFSSDQNTCTKQVLRYTWDAIQAKTPTEKNTRARTHIHRKGIFCSSESKSEMIHQWRWWFSLIDSFAIFKHYIYRARMCVLYIRFPFVDRKVSQITLILIGSFSLLSLSLALALPFNADAWFQSTPIGSAYTSTNKVQLKLKLGAHLFITIIKPNLFSFIYAIEVGFSIQLGVCFVYIGLSHHLH